MPGEALSRVGVVAKRVAQCHTIGKWRYDEKAAHAEWQGISMATQSVTQAEREITRFLVGRPTHEEIAAFHPSAEAAERFSELRELEQSRPLSDDEHEELEAYLSIEHFVRLLKAEAAR